MGSGMRRPLPTDAEVREILSRRRSRPPPRPAPRAGRALQKLVKDMDERFGRGAGALEPRWREIVGERLARVCRPQKLSKGRGGQGGTLELRVVGPAALLVQHQAETILAQVNLVLGAGAVERLRISQGPVPPLPQADAGPTRPAAPPPLSAAAEAELRAQTAAAAPHLAEALTRLGRALRR
jgi:hypothetical protein